MKKLLICIAAISVIAIPSYMAYRSWALDMFVIRNFFGISTMPKSLRVIESPDMDMFSLRLGPDLVDCWYAVSIDSDEFDLLEVEQYREDPPQFSSNLIVGAQCVGFPREAGDYVQTPIGLRPPEFVGKSTFHIRHRQKGQKYFGGGRMLLDETDSPTLRLYFGTKLPYEF